MPTSDTSDTEENRDRRDFLAKCGQFAAITPPAVTFLLSTSLTSKAIAASSGRPSHGSHGGKSDHGPSGGKPGNGPSGNKPGNGYGDQNHGHSGPPGRK